jgi:hypothetical protein
MAYPDIRMEHMRPSDDNDPLLYSQRPTTVTDFLCALLAPEWIEVLETAAPNVWRRLGQSWVNFNHFSEDIAHKEAFDSLSQEGLFAAYLRGRAIMCKRGQTGLDLVMPMIVIPAHLQGLRALVNISHISAIVVQVKNMTKDSSEFTTKFTNDHQFDIRHIRNLRASSELPYVGIWMSLRSHMNDLSIENSVSRPFTRKIG